MDGPKLLCIFEVLFEQVRMSVAFYYKPRIDLNFEARVSDGLLTSGPIAIF